MLVPHRALLIGCVEPETVQLPQRPRMIGIRGLAPDLQYRLERGRK